MFGLVFIAPILFSLQSSALKDFGLRYGNNKFTSNLFELIFFILSALIAVPFAFYLGSSSAMSILLGLLYGGMFFLFINLYSSAMKEGPLSITCFIFSCSMILTIGLSIAMLGESITIFQIVGLILILIALYFINFANQHSKKAVLSKKWALLCTLGAVVNGAVLFLTKYFAVTVTEPNLGQFMLMGNVVCISLTALKFFMPSSKEHMDYFKFNWRMLVLALVVAIGNVIGNGLVSFLGKYISSSILFPINNVFSVMVSILISILYFKEKMTKKTAIGMFIGLIAILFLSL